MKNALLCLAVVTTGCASCSFLPGGMEPPASLAAAESAFASHSVREDMRVAFMAHFADDGVFVRRGWVTANAALRDQPAPAIVLDWRPAYVETAASGDFGLSTGPWKITSKAKPDTPPSHGQFVSIWKRDGNGPWKVAVDLGIDHPQPAFWDTPLQSGVVYGAGSAAAGGIGTAELRFERASRLDGLRAAYRAQGADNLRFYRSGAAPVVGLASALASGAMNDERLVYRVDRSETARSGDFGYARGSYAAAAAPAATLGYFMRAWRLERGEWKIAMDVTNPVR